jgi:hypothetical protein
MSASYAGPCSQAIDNAQAKFDAKLDAQAAVGPTAPEAMQPQPIISQRRTQLRAPKRSLASYRTNE